MGAFCEDSRVKFPTLMHLMGMGYKYISQRGLFTKYVTIPKTESDTLTNILLQPFSEAYLRLNPLSTQDDADAMLHRIQKSLNNDDLGRQFYKEILLDTTNKIIDLSSPTNFIRNNTFQVATEMTCGDLSCDNFRPDITIFINGLPLAFIEVKKENNHEGVDAERKRMKTRKYCCVTIMCLNTKTIATTKRTAKPKRQQSASVKACSVLNVSIFSCAMASLM